MKVKLELPQHSEPTHSITVYVGTRYQFNHTVERAATFVELEVPDDDDVRFVHAAVQRDGSLQAPEYRAVCRVDGNWLPYRIVDAELFGLPPLKVTDPCQKETADSADQEDAECHLDDCECADDE